MIEDNLPKSPLNLRREPTQERAQKTIETIFEATTQIYEEEGDAALTTSKIAKKAGFSIGTLYQYFPSREAIFKAMNDRMRAVLLARLDKLLTEAEQNPNLDIEGLVRAYIHVLIETLVTGNKMWRLVVSFGWRFMEQQTITTAIQTVSDRILLTLNRRQDLGVRPTTPWMMFVLTRSVLGALRSANMEKSMLGHDPQFEDELVHLALGFLKA